MFFNNLSHSTTLTLLHEHVFAGTVLAVSDGLSYPITHLGACGWIISTPDQKEWIQGGCIIPGDLVIHNAYMTDLGERTGIALFFNTFIIPERFSSIQYV